MKYKNPWYRAGGVSPPMFAHENPKCYTSPCGRGVIVQVFNNHFDYLVDGRVVSQRCGKSMDKLAEFIAIVDGNGNEIMYADRIKEAFANGR